MHSQKSKLASADEHEEEARQTSVVKRKLNGVIDIDVDFEFYSM